MQDIQKELKFFDRVYATHDNNISSPYVDFVFSLLDKFEWKGVVLEGGCGDGIVGKELVERYESVTVVGVDIHRGSIARGRREGLPRYRAVCGTLEEMKLFRAGSFDYVLFPHVLHHFPDIKPVIRNAAMWLKGEGWMIILDPNGSNSILRISYWLRMLWDKVLPGHEYASENEKHVDVETFLEACAPAFKDVSVSTFLRDSKPRCSWGVLRFLGYLRYYLLKSYWRCGFARYPGSDLMIVARKA